MPVYEYRCSDCGQRFEEYLTASTASTPPCAGCASGNVVRLWSPFATEWKPANVNWHRVGASWGEKPAKKVF